MKRHKSEERDDESDVNDAMLLLLSLVCEIKIALSRILTDNQPHCANRAQAQSNDQGQDQGQGQGQGHVGAKDGGR